MQKACETNEYADKERQDWQKRSRLLFEEMRKNGTPLYIDVLFKVPVQDVPERYFAELFDKHLDITLTQEGQYPKFPELDIVIRKIDWNKVIKHFEDNVTRANSPHLINVLIGEYESGGNYTLLMSESEIQFRGLDDGLHVLNKFIA